MGHSRISKASALSERCLTPLHALIWVVGNGAQDIPGATWMPSLYLKRKEPRPRPDSLTIYIYIMSCRICVKLMVGLLRKTMPWQLL